MVRVLSKSVGDDVIVIVSRRRKSLKLHLLTCPKTFQNVSQKINDKNLMFGVYILISYLLVESLKANKN